MIFTLSIEIVTTHTAIKEDYRGATKYIEAHAKPQDVIVLSAPFTIFPFEYYYHGNTSITTLPIWDQRNSGPIPTFTLANLPDQVKQIAGSHQNLWLLLSYDQGYQKDIHKYFDDHYELLVKNQFSPGVTLYEYKLKYN